ncbi:MAG: hypothetical protein EA360_02335 [Balneolaceae bacterium]|nr:MAG: hypothetical protein EA360_02335 [Balneolaceae bacterium]
MSSRIHTPLLTAILIPLLFLTDPVLLFSQHVPVGFSIFNNRNHPELNWVSAETDHFIINYPEHLSGIEYEAASIAEAAYQALSENMGVTFDYKIRIFLSDEDEIINGFAVPFSRAYTNIWVNLNDVAVQWSGPEKWLRTVLAHELAHIFHFEAVKSNIPLIGTLGTAPGLPVPWTEGIAQYMTEPWHALRGDALLRAAFYDGRPSFRDGSSLLNGQLMYATGNSQLRYFASVYGDSLLPKILEQREKKLFGLIRLHDFEEGFKEVTGTSFPEFEEEWRRHMAIYYHSLAGQMERSDSLGSKAESLPGQFIQDLRFSPDTTKIAVLALKSAEEPYLQLYVAQNDSTRNRRVLSEGSIRPPLSWSPDGTRIAYSAITRGQYGSLINDLYISDAETGRRERLTHSRRASNPVFTPDGDKLFYVVNESGTGNIFSKTLFDGAEERLTRYEGDHQIGWLAMHPAGTHLAYATFEADGSRHIAVRNLQSGEVLSLTRPEEDDRHPVWSPDGTRLLYTSLRDQVPNIFVTDPFLDEANEERVTFLFTGGTARQWLPADSLHTEGRLVITATDTKRDSKAYLIDAARRSETDQAVINPSYSRWLTHTPPAVIPSRIDPDPSLIRSRAGYRSFRNISHVTTIPFPLIGSDNTGIGLITAFSEPLSNHMFTALGAISFTNFEENSLIFLSYMNNQFRPQLSLNAYHNSFTARIYERDFLVTTNSGAFLLASLPRDWIDSPFVNTTLYSRFRFDYTDGSRFWDREGSGPVLGFPESGWQNDLRIGMRIQKQKPYLHNLIHPLNGWGVEPRITAAAAFLGGETEFIRTDLTAYAVLPAPGSTRFYLYGRAIAQSGNAFVQDYIGFSRFDEIEIGAALPGLDVLYTDAERVRGFSDYVTGDRLFFGTLEYRIPFISDLNTRFLGIVSLRRTTLSAFLDAGMVRTEQAGPGESYVKRAGAGLELKNVLQLGPLSLVHSLGYAQPVQDLGKERNQEVYYRVKAVIPF